MTQKLLTSAEAAAALGVQLPTLYAYVSRGLLRSRPGADQRQRLYAEADVRALASRRDGRRDPAKTVRGALDFGAPIRESALTLIDGGRFYYRGHDAVVLASEERLEAVAALLWTGKDSPKDGLFGPDAEPPTVRLPAAMLRLPATERLSVVLRLAKAADPASSDLRPDRVAQCGARILTLFVETVAAASPGSRGGTTNRGAAASRRRDAHRRPLAKRLQLAWAPRMPAATRVVDAALVLCADHELNVSSFTARCVASAGATLYDVVAAGLAALSGYRHGGYSDRVEALFDELGLVVGRGKPPGRSTIRDRLSARLERGERIPGFGQRLYPDGDPRFPALLTEMTRLWPSSPLLESIVATTEEASKLVGEPPTIDAGLATLARLLRLGNGGARTIFSLGRTVGWIAHAIEEYELGALIRPRARYTGPMPATDVHRESAAQ